MTSSEDDDNDDLNKLREAANHQFISNDLFNGKSKIKPHEQLPSLRQSKQEDSSDNLLNTTPEFRNYVAKHLNKILNDTLLEETRKITGNCNTVNREKSIKLLKNSRKIKENFDLNKEPCKKPVRKSQEVCNYQEIKSSVINLEQIQSEVRNWSKRSKAPIYNYLKRNNQLILQEK